MATTIFEITPTATDKLYGKALNEHIQRFPEDSWICVRDRDTAYLPGVDSGAIMQRAIEKYPGMTLFSCSTNRSWGQKMDDNPNIIDHIHKAKEMSLNESYKPIKGIVPAHFWLFPRALWVKHPFDNNPIIHRANSFDVRWTRFMNCRKIKIEHLYLFHIYRLGSDVKSFEHLL